MLNIYNMRHPRIVTQSQPTGTKTEVQNEENILKGRNNSMDKQHQTPIVYREHPTQEKKNNSGSVKTTGMD